MENSETVLLIRKDSKIVQIFELCLQPRTKEDLYNIMLDFKERIKTVIFSKEREFFGMFDYVCMYILDYVFNHDTASFCSVSRALYLYQKLDETILEGKRLNLNCNCVTDSLLKSLQEFTNLYADSDSEDLLVEVGLSAILNGNIGLALYLTKFRLTVIPSEVNEKCRKIFKVLVIRFNNFFKAITENVKDDDGNMETPVSLHDLLYQIEEREINIKRSVFTFFILTIAMEYELYEIIEEDLKEDFGEDFENFKCLTEDKKNMCLRNLMCINSILHATMELRITFRDIENFSEEFLNPFLTAEVGKYLVDTCRKLLDDSYNYYNTRSLKDLARLKVRSIFQNSVSVPEQVNKLDISVALKEFLNFSDQGIWKLLVNYRLNLSVRQDITRHAPAWRAKMQKLKDRN